MFLLLFNSIYFYVRDGLLSLVFNLYLLSFIYLYVNCCILIHFMVYLCVCLFECIGEFLRVFFLCVCVCVYIFTNSSTRIYHPQMVYIYESRTTFGNLFIWFFIFFFFSLLVNYNYFHIFFSLNFKLNNHITENVFTFFLCEKCINILICFFLSNFLFLVVSFTDFLKKQKKNFFFLVFVLLFKGPLACFEKLVWYIFI